jgi:hypothetical protein
MTKKWIAINLLLLLIAGLLAWQLRVSVFKYRTDNDLAKIQPAQGLKQKSAQEKNLPPKASPRAYNPAEFSVIPEKNVFSETRSREDRTDALAAPEVPPLAQKPILVGITISGNQRLASIIDPLGQGQAQGRRAQIKRIGDVYQGYTITEITPEQIVLDSGTRKEIIAVHQGTKKSQGGKTPIIATRTVAFGAGGTGGTASVATVAGSASTARPAAATTAVSTAVPASQPGAVRTTTVQGRQPSGTAQQPVQPQVQQQVQPSGQGGTRTIRTPFGDIVRPNP